MLRTIGNLLGWWFPIHQTHRRFRSWRWTGYSEQEAYLRDASDLADLERRMRIWLSGGGQG
jgi:Protein of unknown function (DUF3563)